MRITPYIRKISNGSIYEYGDFCRLTCNYELFICDGKVVNRRYTLTEMNKEPDYEACNIMISIGKKAYIKTTYDGSFRIYDESDRRGYYIRTVNLADALQWLSRHVPRTDRRYDVIAKTLRQYAIERDMFTAPNEHWLFKKDCRAVNNIIEFPRFN